jgi:hypothetical protein
LRRSRGFCIGFVRSFSTPLMSVCHVYHLTMRWSERRTAVRPHLR